MAAEQQVIYQQLQPTFLEKRLNELGAEGWQLQDISTNMIVRKGGGIFLLPSGYYFDSHFFTLEKTGEQHQYRCRLFRCIKPDDDLAAINEEIRKQNADAFTLRQILHVSGISDIPERPSRGTAAHFCIFEKSMTLHLADGQTPEETKGTTIMSNSFTRTFDSASIQALRGTSLFQHRMLSDIRGGAVFPAVRNGRMDFYHGGGKLFTYRNNDFETHLKYASVLRYPGDYITETELTTAAPITSFSDSDAYARIKENCARYAGPEAAGVAVMYRQSYTATTRDVVVLDIEISLAGEDGQDRIDVLLYNKCTQALRFCEVKHYSNSEIWAEEHCHPRVRQQMARYADQIKQRPNEIVAAYQYYVQIVNQVFGLQLPLPQKIDPIPLFLLIFGYDNDQLQGRFDRLLLKDNSLAKMRHYHIGNLANLDLTSTWDKLH